MSYTPVADFTFLVEQRLRAAVWQMYGLRKGLADTLSANPNCSDDARAAARRQIERLSDIVEAVQWGLDQLPDDPRTRSIFVARLVEVSTRMMEDTDWEGGEA